LFKDIKITVKLIIYFSFFFVSFFIVQSTGQVIRPITVDIEVNNELLDYPFVGGLTAPQFSQADLNNDGVDDLIVFDRTGDVVVPFLSIDGSFVFAPGYANNFPSPRQWMLLRDFDGDGLKDLFMAPTTNGIAGVEVQRGVIVDKELTFELASATEDGFNVIKVPLGNIETQVFNSLADFPGIEDLDGDGDLDIVSFEPGGSTVTLYKNMSVERTGEPGLDYIISSDCFGLIVESGFSEEISLSPDGVACGNFLIDGQTESRHAGSTLTLFDQDLDGVLEVVVGDISNDGLVILKNSGTPESAWFSEQDLNFPDNNNPVKINIFNTAFFEDINKDGEADLIVAPNEQSGLQTTNHIWYYEAVPSPEGPSFELTTMNFLVDEMLFFGKDAAPVFVDFNNDGLMDILVGSAGLTDFDVVKNPRLTLLRNTGSIDEPAFTLEDDDYLGFSNFVTTSTHFFPTIGDLDNDGDSDLLIGDDNGFFYFLENTAGPDAPFEFANPIYEYQNLRPGQFVKPSIFDFNNDGLNDLVVGERNFNTVDDISGSLNYIQNTGAPGAPIFNVDDATTNQVFGNVFTKDQGFIRNLSAPATFVSEGRTMMLVGTESGKIRLLDDIDENLTGTFTELATTYGDIQVGNETNPAVFDLNNDGFFELLVGNRRGGLSLFTTDIVSAIRSSTNDQLLGFDVAVYPNPASNKISVETELNIDKLELYDLSGKLLRSSSETTQLDNLSPLTGTYFLKIYSDAASLVHKLVLIN